MKKFLIGCGLGVVVFCFAPARDAHAFAASASPRFWVTSENLNAFDSSAFTTFVQLRSQITTVLRGASISITPMDKVPLDVLINFYTGSGNGRYRQVQPVAGGDFIGTFEVKRTDAEILLRYRPEGKTVNYFTGFRLNNFKDNLTVNTPVGSRFNSSGTNKIDRTTKIFLWELGAGFFVPANEKGSQRFIGGLGVGIGTFETEQVNALPAFKVANEVSGYAYAWDTNAGYEVLFGNHFSVLGRYRMYARPANKKDIQVAHGPEFAATVRF